MSAVLATPMGRVQADFHVITTSKSSTSSTSQLYPSSGDVRDANIFPGMPIFARYAHANPQKMVDLQLKGRQKESMPAERIGESSSKIKVRSTLNREPIDAAYAFMGIADAVWSPFRQDSSSSSSKRAPDMKSMGMKGNSNNTLKVVTDGIVSFVYKGTPVQEGDTLIITKPRQTKKNQWTSSVHGQTTNKRLTVMMEAIEYQTFRWDSFRLVVDYECLFSMMRYSQARLSKTHSSDTQKINTDVTALIGNRNTEFNNITQLTENEDNRERLLTFVSQYMTLDFKQRDVHVIMCLWHRLLANNQTWVSQHILRMLHAHMTRMLLYKKYITVGRALVSANDGDIIDVFLGKACS